MRTFNIQFTHWDDELKMFLKEEAQFIIKNKTFVIMFNELTKWFNKLCSTHHYDISWIDSITEVK